MTAEPIRYAVVCDCDGARDVLAWINDERPRAYGLSFGVTNLAEVDELRMPYGPNYSLLFGHPACKRSIDISRRGLGELLDAIVELQRHIGADTIEVAPMTWRRGDDSTTEQRIVIPFHDLCEWNGRLQRFKTAPRRTLP